MLLACYRDLIMVWYCDPMREISSILLLINSLFISCFWFAICHLLAKLFLCCRDFLKSVCLSLRVFPFLDSSLNVSLLPPSLGGESLGGRGICEGIN